MNPIVQQYKQHTDKTIESFKQELKSIRTGRATPALVETLPVEVYNGTMTMRLLELAALTTEGPTTIVIVPFDPSTTEDIERAIQKSTLGLSPSTQGTRILIQVPPLSQEQREKFTKLIGQMSEEKRVQIRGKRDEAKRHIKQGLDAKELTEDDKFRLEKELDEITHKSNESVQTIREVKEKEIMTI